MMTLEELEILLEQKRCLQPVVLKHGKVSTEQSLVVTGAEAMEMVNREEELIWTDKATQPAREAQKAALDKKIRAQRHAQRKSFQSHAFKKQMKPYDVPNVLSRPLKVCMAVAKDRVKAKKALDQKRGDNQPKE